MAIDTAIKRSSALRLLRPWAPIGFFPDGTIDAGDRAATVHGYSGIDIDAPSASAGISGGITADFMHLYAIFWTR